MTDPSTSASPSGLALFSFSRGLCCYGLFATVVDMTTTKKIKMTATAPDGTVHARTTANGYSHAVLVEYFNAELHAEAVRSVTWSQDYVARLEAVTPDDSQWSVRDHNMQHAARSLAKAVAALAVQPETGTTWAAISFHGREALAIKAADTLRTAPWATYASVLVVPVD